MTCPCGRTHISPTPDILIGPGALASLAGLVAKHSNPNGEVFLLTDENCYAAAGREVLTALGSHFQKNTVSELILSCEPRACHLLPDERSLGRVFAECPPGAGLILAVGSGTINDLARFAASRLKIPYIVVAAAPSMDGYASSVCALLIDGFKTTYAAVAPCAIIGDADILENAPAAMKGAGFGDMIGKCTSLSDWRLGSLIFGEYHCRYIENIVERAVEKCAANPRDAVALMEGLCLSGTAMSYAGDSRPASGAEHHLAHFWEMKFISEHGRDAWANGSATAERSSSRGGPLHGQLVGVAALAMLRIRRMLRENAGGYAVEGTSGRPDAVESTSGRPDAALANAPAVFEYARERARGRRAASSASAYEDKIREIYGQNAGKIIAEGTAWRRPENVLARIGLYGKKWGEILAECDRTPPAGSVRKLLESAGAPICPQDLCITRAEFVDGIVYAKEIRPRFTILRLLADLGVLEEYAEALADEVY